MNTDSGSNKGFWGLLGLSPKTSYGKLFVGGLILFVVALIALLILALFGGAASTRYPAAIVLLFVGALGPIPLALLVIFGRRVGCIQRILDGNYWVKWEYDSSIALAANQSREVLLGPDGIYWVSRGKLVDFGKRLDVVDLQKDQLVYKYQVSRGKYGQYESTQEEVVPIPRGKEAEAEALAARFRREVAGRVSFNYRDQWTIGLVMGAVILGAVFLWIPLGVSLDSAKRQEGYQTSDAMASLEAATAMVQINASLRTVRPVIEPQLAGWQAQKDVTEQHLSAADAGFGPNDNVKEVVYGRCADETFYVLVLQATYNGRPADSQTGILGYSKDTTCAPYRWEISYVTRLDGSWYAATLNTYLATLFPSNTPARRTPTVVSPK